MDVVGRSVYLAMGGSGVLVLDATDPFSPTVAGRQDALGTATDIQALGELLYVADGEEGLFLLRDTVTHLLWFPLALRQ